MSRVEMATSQLRKTNEELISELSNLDIRKIQISSIGNSIATGFSAMSTNRPLLSRNESLPEIAKANGIKLDTYQFSRFENNSDEHTLNSLLSNKKESAFNAESRCDYKNFRMNGKQLLSKEQALSYYPEDVQEDRGMADVLLDAQDGLANFVIANVGTGAFLDNWTRGGHHLFTNGIAKDRAYIESLLGIIQFYNRQNYANTQVYLCGAPRILNTPLTDIFINSPLKTIAKRYANVIYVPSISRKVLYQNSIMPFPFPDTHYDEEEYIRLLNKIGQSMTTSFHLTSSLIEIDRLFSNRSREIEMTERKIDTRDEILSTLEQYADIAEESGKSRKQFLESTRSYLLERYPYDFYYLDKQAIKESTKVLQKHK